MSESSKSNEHILVFEDVVAQVSGIDISSIAELSLVAAANSIPQITLLVDAGMRGGGGQMYVNPVSLSNAKSILDQCRSMVRTGSATLNLSIKCSDVGPAGGKSETLKISGWILTDVSMSPIQMGGNCTVSLTFQHPICRADFGGCIPGAIGVVPDLEQVEGDNPLEVFVSALKLYSSAYRESALPIEVPGSAPAQDVIEGLARHLDRSISALSSSLKWTGGGLPAANHFTDTSLIVRGISTYGIPGGVTSVLHTLVSQVVPECSLAIGGDYTQGSLDIGPFRPWSSAELTMDESDITSLQFPARDPSPISGVKVAMMASESETFVSYMPATAQSPYAGKPVEAIYVPAKQLAADYLYGPIHIVQEPGWLAQMSSYEKPAAAATYSDSKLARTGGMQTDTTTSEGGVPELGGGVGKDVPAVDYGNAILACAKAYYETMLMKDWCFTVDARLVMSAGGIICPGKVISIKAQSGEAISGYVVQVEHVISVRNRSAHTRIVCAYPRFGSLPDGITGSENALYS